MFVVDEETAEAIRRAWEGGGELASVVELRRHFPLIADDARARRCVRAIVGWGARSAPDPKPAGQGPGTTQVRDVRREGDRLVHTTRPAPFSADGETSVVTAVWQKAGWAGGRRPAAAGRRPGVPNRFDRG